MGFVHGFFVVRLAEYLHAPILTLMEAKGVVDELHPLALGVVGGGGAGGVEELGLELACPPQCCFIKLINMLSDRETEKIASFLLVCG